MVFIELRRRATAGEGVKELKEVNAVTLTGVQRTLLEGGGIILAGGCGRFDTELGGGCGRFDTELGGGCGRFDTELGGAMVDISLGGTACFEASGYGVVLLLTAVLFKCKLGEERGEPSELLGDVGGVLFESPAAGDVGGVVFESPAAGDVGDVVFESAGGESNWTDDLNVLSWASWSSSAHATPFSL